MQRVSSNKTCVDLPLLAHLDLQPMNHENPDYKFIQAIFRKHIHSKSSPQIGDLASSFSSLQRLATTWWTQLQLLLLVKVLDGESRLPKLQTQTS